MYIKSIKYQICKAYLSVTRFIYSLLKSRELCLGTKVIYNGSEMYVSKLSYPEIALLKNKDYGKPIYAKRADIQKVKSFGNFIHDATYNWKWYKKCWLSIDTKCLLKGKPIASVRITRFGTGVDICSFIFLSYVVLLLFTILLCTF